MNDNIMITLATKREGFDYPLLKWHRVIENTFLKSKNQLKSRNYDDPYCVGFNFRLKFVLKFQFRIINPTIAFQSHTNKQSIIIQEYKNKSTRYQISIVIQTKPSLQAYNQCNHVGLPNPQLLGTVIGRTLESLSCWRPSPRVRK